MPLLIFIAGPLSAPSIEAQERNVEHAMLAAHDVFRAGHLPVCPHLTHYFDVFATAFLSEPPRYEQHLALSLEQVRRCDAVLFLGSSPGADRELALARELSLPVFLHVNEIPLAIEAVR